MNSDSDNFIYPMKDNVAYLSYNSMQKNPNLGGNKSTTNHVGLIWETRINNEKIVL